MKKPVLAILAAGMGSRYGGLKQMDPMDEYGNVLLDFSVYDALRAGFEDVVFIIKEEIEADFRSRVGDKLSRYANVRYAYQELWKLPEGISLPEGRSKPWGTAHAVICAEREIGGAPFAVINSDDFYGGAAYAKAYAFLNEHVARDEHAIVCYRLGETLTDHGSVNRGVCVVSEGYLTEIHERLGIVRHDGAAAYPDADGSLVRVPLDASVSMNFWAFNTGIMDELKRTFGAYIAEAMTVNPLKCEDHLPEAVMRGLSGGRMTVKALVTPDRWIGVTHKADKPMVMAALRELKRNGVYPEKLWD
ncbi:MAG: sugar phosphate nucleotidyltransferase [Clostridia bacterium]|nr:sugar phosphate nucleotidyltransferase [Clostridia bacterium]